MNTYLATRTCYFLCIRELTYTVRPMKVYYSDLANRQAYHYLIYGENVRVVNNKYFKIAGQAPDPIRNVHRRHLGLANLKLREERLNKEREIRRERE